MLWVSGPTGVGKSTIGHRVYLDVLRSDAHAAFVDVDQLGFSNSAAGDTSLQARNLAAIWRNFSDNGAALAVVVGDVSTRDAARAYEQALHSTKISWCQLRVRDAELTRRILSRRGGGSWTQPGDPVLGLPEHELLGVARRAIAASSRIHQNSIGLVVDVDDLDTEHAAAKVLELTRWPTRAPRPHSH